MTQVKIRKDKDTVINIDGHALYNPGNDIVCAGVSTLAYTLINTLNDVKADFEFKAESGSIHIVIHEDTPYVRMFEIGIASIAERFPDNVEVIY